jgi:hypothetical protein
MKNLMFVLIILILSFAGTVNAQEKGKIRGGLNFGYTVPVSGGGSCFIL